MTSDPPKFKLGRNRGVRRANNDSDSRLQASPRDMLDVYKDKIVQVQWPATMDERFAVLPRESLAGPGGDASTIRRRENTRRTTNQKGLHLLCDDVRELGAGLGKPTTPDVAENVHLTAVLVVAGKLISASE